MGERLVGCAPKGATTSQLCLPFYKHFTATRFFRQTQLKQGVNESYLQILGALGSLNVFAFSLSS